jgi:tetratricopeptide (TPR) repeat protein
MYKKALDLQPEDIRIMDSIARFYVKNKRVDDAEKYITKILKERSQYFPTRMLKGELLVYQHKFDEAVLLFDQLIKEEPKLARSYYFKGLAHLGKGENRIAKTALGKAVELNPKYVKAKLLLAEIYMREHDYSMAQKESAEVLGTAPGNYHAKLILGNAYLNQRKIKEAKETFESLIKLEPEKPAGYYRLGILYRLIKEYDLALKNFEKAMSINPNLMDVFTNIILVHVDKKEFETAMLKCDSQLETMQGKPELLAIIHNLKGKLYLAQRKNEEAQESFQKALKENPNFLQPYYALGRLYLMERKEDKAIGQYKTILEKNPKQTGPHMVLGTIYDIQKQFDLSEKHYRAALDIDPDFAPAANNLAYLLLTQDKNIDEALGLAQQAKEKLPYDPNVMDTLGLVFYKKGLYDSAIAEFSDSLEKIPDNAIVHYHLGLAYHKKGDIHRARIELEKALSLNQNFDEADAARQILSKL